MKRTATVLAAAVLAAACAEIPEAPPSLADQFAEQAAERADEDRPAETPDEEVDGTPPDDPAPSAGDSGSAPDEQAALWQAVADADARCEAIYARGDELALDHLDPDPGRSPEDIDAELDEIFELTRSLTEEVVESLEQGAREDARLEDIASSARSEMLPIFLELIDLMATADEAELETFGTQAWPRLSGFVDELASVGFRHCFQEQSLVP